MTMKWLDRRTLALAAVVMTAIACDVKTSSSPTTPGPTPGTTQQGVSGRWSTDLAVQGVSARMQWMLTQNSGGVTGPVLVSLPSGTVLLNGSLTGSVTGSSMPYTISVGPGGIPTQPTCTGQFGGTMTVGVTTMTGSMALVSSNCTVQFPTGGITLVKQ
jgi:hypothetical protein